MAFSLLTQCVPNTRSRGTVPERCRYHRDHCSRLSPHITASDHHVAERSTNIGPDIHSNLPVTRRTEAPADTLTGTRRTFLTCSSAKRARRRLTGEKSNATIRQTVFVSTLPQRDDFVPIPGATRLPTCPISRLSRHRTFDGSAKSCGTSEGIGGSNRHG